MGTTALVSSVGSGALVVELYLHNDTMIRILLFSLVISLALGLPQLSGRPGAVAAPVFPPRAGLEHAVVRRSPEEPAPESEPEAGDEAEAEGEPEPESESTD